MGYLHVYTGSGKGKTTCAAGLAIRAAGAAQRVAFIQFDKGYSGDEHYNERRILRSAGNIDVYTFGLERLMPDGTFRFEATPEDIAQAQIALEKARSLVEAGEHFLIICDEAVTCVMTKLLREDEILGLVTLFRNSPAGDLVLTGRGAFPALIEAADLVTEMLEVKHYFRLGVKARPGIDY